MGAKTDADMKTGVESGLCQRALASSLNVDQMKGMLDSYLHGDHTDIYPGDVLAALKELSLRADPELKALLSRCLADRDPAVAGGAFEVLSGAPDLVGADEMKRLAARTALAQRDAAEEYIPLRLRALSEVLSGDPVTGLDVARSMLEEGHIRSGVLLEVYAKNPDFHAILSAECRSRGLEISGEAESPQLIPTQ